MEDWKNFGYETNKPCDVCGKEGDNQMEPRFGYVVCEEHYKMTPLQVTEAKERRLKKYLTKKE